MAAKRKNSAATGKQVNPKKVKIDDYTLSWIEAVENYVRETGADVLDLENRGLGEDAVQAILNILPDSQVTEVNLKGNLLENGIGDLGPLLIKTKIRRLDFSKNLIFVKTRLLKLLRVLKDCQITNLSLSLSGMFELNTKEAKMLISYLKKSKLKTLHLNFHPSVAPIARASFFQSYSNTSITCLKLVESKISLRDFTSLFANLGRSSVTDLDLMSCKVFSCKVMQELSQNLVNTKIEKLNLGKTGLNNERLRILVAGLVNSKVTDLNLEGNRFSSLDPLFTKLKATQILTLNLAHNYFPVSETSVYLDCSPCASLSLAGCRLGEKFGEALMKSLRFSNVMELDVSFNDLGPLTVRTFSENVRDIKLIDLNISYNRLSRDAFFILGKCIKESKLTRINVGNILPAHHLNVDNLLLFLKLTEGSSIRHINLSSNNYIWNPQAVGEPQMLANTTFTELRLCKCKIGHNVVAFLKFTAVTYLDLSWNKIIDDGAVTLAGSLRGTQIRRLNLDHNWITNRGAKALALSLKDSNLLYLHLNSNYIGNDGLEFLAESAKNTFVSEIGVLRNPGKNVLLVDKVLWQNKISVHKLVHTFKQITSKTNSDSFCFDQNSENLDVDAFLEKCMMFYRTVIDKPRAINVLLEDKEITFSKEQILRLFEEFPRQFSDFIACRVEANVSEHVAILEKAEEMGLAAVVESLLLNRPVYMLDEGQGILHPQVYKLLLKYKQPVCNLAVEPRGVVKIIKYFTEHSHIDGAQDVVNLLQNANVS